MVKYELIPVGDAAIRIKLGDMISLETNKKVHLLMKKLMEKRLEGMIEMVPSYHSLTIYYEPLIKTYEKISNEIHRFLEKELTTSQVFQSEIVYIPTLYGQEVGPDLAKVADCHHLSEEEVIKIHSKATYFIYLIGFLPGFPYLGGMSKNIATPRLPNPRSRIQPGSIGIAGEQTGIYPIQSPGGWNIIGQTPVQIIRQNEQDSFPLKAGQYLRFEPITIQEFATIKKLESTGSFKLKKEVYEDELEN